MVHRPAKLMPLQSAPQIIRNQEDTAIQAATVDMPVARRSPQRIDGEAVTAVVVLSTASQVSAPWTKAAAAAPTSGAST